MRRAEKAALAAAAGLVVSVALLSGAGQGGISAGSRHRDWAAPLAPQELEDLGMLVPRDPSSSSSSSSLRGVENVVGAAADSWEHALMVMLGDDDAVMETSNHAAVDSSSSDADDKTGAERFQGQGWQREIFLTTHGGNAKHATAGNNVRVYRYAVSNPHLHHWDPDGLAIEPQKVESLGLQNLRGMAAVGPALFVASAHSSRSKIVLLHKCSKDDKATKTFAVDGLDHPYGVAFFRGALYASNQNTNEVVRFWLKDGLGAKAHKFAHVSHPRGLAFDRAGRLWVASTKKGVHVFDLDGKQVAHLNVNHAVGVAVDLEGNGMVYVGSVDGTNSGIYGFSPDTFKTVVKLQVPKPHKLTHPAGLTIVDDRLLVVAQDEKVLYAFCTRTGTFKGAVLTDLPTRPEQIALLRCN